MNMALLNASAISVRRGKHITLHPTNFAASAGETVGIYGPNGAGKSTLLGVLAAAVPADGGRAPAEATLVWDGEPVATAAGRPAGG